MIASQIQIDQADVNKLLCAANGDAALLYLYIRSGNRPDGAAAALNMNDSRVACATASLRQLGLWPDDRPRFLTPGERPRYSETDVILAADTDNDFQQLRQEVENQLGKILVPEELKILLGFVRYLNLPTDVVCILVNFCKTRARNQGRIRPPSLRTIEKEAYAWAEMGIDTTEEAIAHMQRLNARYSRMGQLMNILQIHGRKLTAAEEKHAQQWLDWGFADEAIAMAYERTCLNTGGLNWNYMNKILTRWQAEGLLTAQQIKSGDQSKKTAQKGPRKLDEDEQAALAALLQEG